MPIAQTPFHPDCWGSEVLSGNSSDSDKWTIDFSENQSCHESSRQSSSISGSINAPPYSDCTVTDESEDDDTTELVDPLMSHHSKSDTCVTSSLASEIVLNSSQNDSPIVGQAVSNNDTSLTLTSNSLVTKALHEASWNGFKIIGDIKPRFMTLDKQSQSVHCFNSVAVKDRIDLSTFSDESLLSPLHQMFQPSILDDSAIMSNFMFLMKRVVCEHMQFFNKSCSDVIDLHIKHKHSENMEKKSEVVSADIWYPSYRIY